MHPEELQHRNGFSDAWVNTGSHCVSQDVHLPKLLFPQRMFVCCGCMSISMHEKFLRNLVGKKIPSRCDRTHEGRMKGLEKYSTIFYRLVNEAISQPAK